MEVTARGRSWFCCGEPGGESVAILGAVEIDCIQKLFCVLKGAVDE